MADNSPNTTREDFTNSTIDTDDLSLLELEQQVHNLEAENEADSFGSDFSINQDGNQNEDPFDVDDVDPIPRNQNDIHDMGGKRKRKRKTRRKTKRKSLKKRRKTKKRNKKNRNTKKRK